ncbi:MAG: tetratricopeptide repeat protein [Acetobacteraceae bacterium]|nr:tetratricopeptide repeat protein [Acetobacteraceae bacterium]
MPLARLPRRIALPPLALLAACASASPPAGSPATGGSEARFRPTGAFGAYLAGRFASSEADTEAAARFFSAALAADPANAELLQRSFAAELADGRDALPLAARILERQPQALMPNLVVLASEVRAGRFDLAETRARALPREGAGQLLQPLLLAWAQAGRDAWDQALATLRPLAEGPRFRAVYALHAGLIADLAGRPREAERFFRAAEAEGSPSLRTAELIAGFASREGRTADAARILASALAGNEEAALAEARLARAPNRRAVASAADGMAEALYSLASPLRQQEASDFALLLLRVALLLRPDFPPAKLLIADILEAERRFEAAAGLLRAVDREGPYGPLARIRLAVVLDRLDRTAEALSLLDTLGAEEGRPEPFARKGDILRRRSRFREAVEAYDAAIARLGPPERRHWVLYYARGIAHERAKDWPRAEADFLRALELSPDQPYVLNYLGYSWADQGRELARARRMLERAVELRPHDGHIVNSLGWVLFRQGDYRGAVRWLERAVELLPRDPVINDHLGDAYWSVGRHVEARFQWQRALALGPEPEEIPKIEAKLRDGLKLPPAAVAAESAAPTPR